MSGRSTDNRPIGNAKQVLSASISGTTDTNLIQIGGNAVNVNGGNRDTGTQTVTLADDDPAVSSLSSVDTKLTGVAKTEELVNAPNETSATGSSTVLVATALSFNFKLHHVTMHLSSAPTSAGEVIVELDAAAGAAYDTVLDRQEMVGKTDYFFAPNKSELFRDGDAIKVTYSNPDSRTYGIRIMAEKHYTPSA